MQGHGPVLSPGINYTYTSYRKKKIPGQLTMFTPYLLKIHETVQKLLGPSQFFFIPEQEI
jgi:hypothetical protein